MGAADVAASAGALLLQVIEKTCCPHTTLCRTKTLPAKAHQSRAMLQMTVDHFGNLYGYQSYTLSFKVFFKLLKYPYNQTVTNSLTI